MTVVLEERYPAKYGGSVYALTGNKILIGRGKDCDIMLNSESISREHGVLFCGNNGRWFYIDLESTNGTKKNGMVLKSGKIYMVRPGDVLQIGEMIFQMVEKAGDGRREGEKNYCYVFTDNRLANVVEIKDSGFSVKRKDVEECVIVSGANATEGDFAVSVNDREIMLTVLNDELLVKDGGEILLNDHKITQLRTVIRDEDEVHFGNTVLLFDISSHSLERNVVDNISSGEWIRIQGDRTGGASKPPRHRRSTKIAKFGSLLDSLVSEAVENNRAGAGDRSLAQRGASKGAGILGRMVDIFFIVVGAIAILGVVSLLVWLVFGDRLEELL